MRFVFYLFILFILILTGCETSEKIDDFPLRPSKMVVNCFFNADSIWEFQVSKSLSVLDNAPIKLIKNATIKLYKEGNLLSTINSADSDGMYRIIENLPETEKEFSIEVSSPDFKDNLYAKDVVPHKIEITQGEIKVIDSSFYQGGYYSWGQLRGAFEISFTDPAGSDNYYQISAFIVDSVFSFYDTGPVFMHMQQKGLSLYSDDQSVENPEKYVPALLLNDFLFDGLKYSISLYFEDYNVKRKKKYYIELTSLTREGYMYQKTVMESDNSRNDPFAEPVIIFSNIENGYGIFSAYSRSVYTLQTTF